MIDDNFPIRLTKFPNLAAQSMEVILLPWAEVKANILAMVPKYPDKASMPLITGVEFGNVVSVKGAYRHDGNVVQAHGVSGDVDDSQGVSAQEALMRLSAANVCAWVITSASHMVPKGAAPPMDRYRVYTPFSRPLTPAEFATENNRLNTILGGILGAESWRMSQSYYFGRLLVGPWWAGACDGRFIDQATEIALTPSSQPIPVLQANAAAAVTSGAAFSFPAAPAAPTAPPTRVKRSNAASTIVARIKVRGLHLGRAGGRHGADAVPLRAPAHVADQGRRLRVHAAEHHGLLAGAFQVHALALPRAPGR